MLQISLDDHANLADGGALRELCDVSIVVPSQVTARIQESHILIGHTLCGLIEQRLGLV